VADRLTLTRAFEGAGLKSDDAERIATEIYDAIHDNVATKADLKNEVAAVRGDLRELEQRLEVRFANIDVRFEKLERRIDQMVIRLGALAVVIAGLLFAALQRWPPH
jgi:predicted  nucleic acid-binding Zn-ribbon protein